MRRFATLALSLSLVLGLTTAGRLLAQDEKKDEVKKEEVKKDDAPKTEAKKEDAPKADAKKEEPKKEETKPAAPAETPLPSIPPEVEAKLEAARRAVAEAIVAAQDAGLVETTIDPPPILDILITGRATDARELKKATKETPEVGLSPEVFGAWFTGYNKPTEGITADKNVRIVQPSKGLKQWYDTRATLLNRHIAEVRKAKADAKPKDEPKPEEKKEEPKKEEPKKEEAPKDEPKKDEVKKEEAPKTEEPKAEAPKAEEPKAEAPKAEEPKKEEAPK